MNTSATNSAKNLNGKTVVELRELAGEKIGSTLTKFQLIAKINTMGGEAPKAEETIIPTETENEPIVATTGGEEIPAEKAVETPKAEIKTINIWEAEVGSVVRYKSSKKPYIVAEKVVEGEKPYLFLVSKTQQYNSTKKEFQVVLVQKGEGTLPTTFETPELNECLNLATQLMGERLALQTAKAEKLAAAKLKAETQPIVETVATNEAADFNEKEVEIKE